jgi:hypothetical protein
MWIFPDRLVVPVEDRRPHPGAPQELFGHRAGALGIEPGEVRVAVAVDIDSHPNMGICPSSAPGDKLDLLRSQLPHVLAGHLTERAADQL